MPKDAIFPHFTPPGPTKVPIPLHPVKSFRATRGTTSPMHGIGAVFALPAAPRRLMNRRIALVVRPPREAEKLADLRGAVAALRAQGHRIAVRRTRRAGDARRLARSAAAAGWDVVVAAGGDGTINEVVNGLVRAGHDSALAIVPLGTANDFARGLGIPLDIGEALRVAVSGRELAVDVARVNRRLFINVSTGGFGARTTRDAAGGLKKKLGGLAYLLSGARNLVKFRVRRAAFRVDGRTVHDGSFIFFAVGNSRQTGGGTPVTPLADVDDGRLDVTIVRGMSRLRFIALLPKLRAGTHLDHPCVYSYRARSLEVRARGGLGVNADGEPVAGGTFHYDVLKRKVRVMVAGGNENRAAP